MVDEQEAKKGNTGFESILQLGGEGGGFFNPGNLQEKRAFKEDTKRLKTKTEETKDNEGHHIRKKAPKA